MKIIIAEEMKLAVAQAAKESGVARI